MNLNNPGSNLFFPSGVDNLNNFSSGYMEISIVAHQDDLEMVGYPGILKCYKKSNKWFGGVVCTNGIPESSGSDNDIRRIRDMEQKKAAEIGDYGFVIQLDYYSSEIKDGSNLNIESDIKKIIEITTPEIVYTHNPFDKHNTHIGVSRAVIKGIRSAKKEFRPKKLFGCEVWGGLDWLSVKDRVEFDVGTNIELAKKLIGIFNSQIKNGKNYEEASIGRRAANATFSDPYQNDITNQVILGLDLTPLIFDEDLDIEKYLVGFADRFREDIKRNISKIVNKKIFNNR